MTPEAPLRLGNYEPLLELASGGMATVYAARQLGAAGFERLVVVKRVHRHLLGNREFFDMFRDEARIAALIHHPNVVAVSDVVETDAELLLVMEYVEGSSLSTLRSAARESNVTFPVRVSTRIAYDALAGLHAAHEATDMRGSRLDIVHRDVSPQNVLVGVDGSSRVIDFGIAKARHRLTETKSGSLKGKYSYMAPEQTRGQPVDRRTDIFAWGIVLHELLTGERLFRGENEFDTMRRIWEAPIPNPSTVNPDVPPLLDQVVQRALARNPDERFAIATDVLDALEKAASLGTHREVAAFVERAAGVRLGERRKALHSLLEGRVAPLALELPTETDESQTTLSPHGPPSMGSDGSIALAQRTIVEGPRTRPRPTVAIAIAAGIGTLCLSAVALAIGVYALRHPGAAAAPTSASSITVANANQTSPSQTREESLATPPPTTTTIELDLATATDLGADEVQLAVSADAPIQSVRAKGLKRLTIDGDTATLVVTKFAGRLRIDATLEGGRTVTALPAAGAPSARLATPKPTSGGSTKRSGGSEPNLQANPYP